MAVSGRLTVTLIQGKDLNDKDIGKMDPFATLQIKGEKHKSKTIKKGGKNPTWNQAFIFNLKGIDIKETLHIQVFDEDLLSNDKCGRADIPLKQLFEDTFDKKEEGHWYQIVDFDNYKHITGYIRIAISWDGDHPSTFGAAIAAPAAAAPAPAPAPQPVYVQPQSPPVAVAPAPVAYAPAPVPAGYAPAPAGYAPAPAPAGYAPAPAPGAAFAAAHPIAAAAIAHRVGAVVGAVNPYFPIDINRNFRLRSVSGGNLRVDDNLDVSGIGKDGKKATWRVVEAKDGRIRIQNQKGEWLTAKPNGEVNGQGKGGPNCWFRVVHRGGNKLSLGGPHGGWVAVQPSGNGKAKNTKNTADGGPHTIFEYVAA